MKKNDLLYDVLSDVVIDLSKSILLAPAKSYALWKNGLGQVYVFKEQELNEFDEIPSGHAQNISTKVQTLIS